MYSLERNSWQLLAGSGRGRVDMEALTGLQAAWASPWTQEILKGSGGWTAARSAWIISETARDFPDDQELNLLAKQAVRSVEEQLPGLVQRLKEAPEDGGAYYRTFYAVLCIGNADALKLKIKRGTFTYADEAASLLMKKNSGTRLETERILAEALLDPTQKSDKALISVLTEQKVRGDDQVMLAGFAAHERGSRVWRIFREECPQITSAQPLNGHVVVMVNGLNSD